MRTNEQPVGFVLFRLLLHVIVFMEKINMKLKSLMCDF